MDSQDLKNPISPGDEHHEVHLCHRCGWPFPNPHPSAKHRRAHKRVCGTIEGYKLEESETGYSPQLAVSVSDDEPHSDEEMQTPSPNTEKSIAKGAFSSGRAGERSNRSDDEVFADAVTEFSDSGASPGIEDRLEAARELVKDVNKVMEDDIDLKSGSAEPQNTSSQISNEFVEIPPEQFMHARQFTHAAKPDDSRNEESAVAKALVADVNVLGDSGTQQFVHAAKSDDSINESTVAEELLADVNVLDDSRTEQFTHAAKSDDSKNEESAVDEALVADVTAHGNTGTQQLPVSTEQDVEVNGKDVNNKKPSETSPVSSFGASGEAPKNESNTEEKDGKTSDDGKLEPSKQEVDEKASVHVNVQPNLHEEEDALKPVAQEGDGTISPDRKLLESAISDHETKNYPLQDRDLEISDFPSVDETPEQKLEMETDVGTQDISSQAVDAPVTLKTETDLAKDVNDYSHGGALKDREMKVEEEADVYVLSVNDDIHVLDNPEIMIKEFKDYELLKFEVSTDLGSSEGIMSAKHDDKGTVSQKDPTSDHSIERDESIPVSKNSDASDISLQDSIVQVPAEREADPRDPREAVGDDAKPYNLEAQTQLSQTELVDSKSFTFKEHNTEGQSDVISVSSTVSEVVQLTPDSGETGNTENVTEMENSEKHFAAENVRVEKNTEDEPKNICSASELVENSSVSRENQVIESLGSHDKQYPGEVNTKSAGTARSESGEVGVEENSSKDKETTQEYEQKVSKSTDSDENIISGEEGIGARGFVNTEALKSPAAFINDDALGSVKDSSEGAKSGPDDCVASAENLQESVLIEPVTVPIATEGQDQGSGNSKDITTDAFGFGSKPVCDSAYDNPDEQRSSTSPMNKSVGSGSRSDSLEGNWGSVSVISATSDAAVVHTGALQSDSQAPENSESGSKERKDVAKDQRLKSDDFEPPSFLTLVEPAGGGVMQTAGPATEIETAQQTPQAKHEALRAGWFPSLTNVVNESQGRKKNEEIIAKVTNWTAGKQHSPLKNLLVEASAESKAKIPNTNQVPSKDDMNAKDNTAPVVTVNSILGSEAPKEWNSPARYPAVIKKEKRKGKPSWIPFVCCSSVQQDV